MKNYFPARNSRYTYLQTNRSDLFGSIWSSFNIDLQSNLGAVRVGERMLAVETSDTDVNLGNVAALVDFDSYYWAVCGSFVFKSDAANEPQEGFSQDTATDTPTNCNINSDLATFDDRLWCMSGDGLHYKNSATGSWTLLDTIPDNGGLMVYGRKFNRLYVQRDSDRINSVGVDLVYTSTGDYTLDLDAQEETIISMCETSDAIWIGTLSTANNASKASIYKWDGISAQPSRQYYIDAPGVYALVTYDDIPYAMDTYGRFLRFNGTAFVEIGRLPFSDRLFKNDGSSTWQDDKERFIHPKGILPTKNGTFLFFVCTSYQDETPKPLSENSPAGIWEFSTEYGFVHKHSMSYTLAETTTITDYGQNLLGTNIDDGLAGPIISAYAKDSASDYNGTILCGGTYMDTASTTVNAIWINDSNNTVQKKGYIVTTWFTSREIEDKWDRVWAVYSRFLNSDDSIVFKYRLTKEEPVYADITWVDTTTFTTTEDISAYGPETTNGFDGTYGGEVEIISGEGSGVCSHITGITENAGTYTVTLDTEHTGVTTNTAMARFQKWHKMFPEITGQVKSWEQMRIGNNNTRIQIKFCMTFTDNGDLMNEFHKFVLESNEDIKANK